MTILELLKGNKSGSDGTGSSLIRIVENALKKDDWSYEHDHEDPRILRTGVKGKNTSLRGTFMVVEEKRIIHFYVHLSVNVIENKRLETMEYITRANYGLQIGNFEMDLRDGEIRFKVSIDVEAGTLSTVMVRNMMSAGFCTVDRYFPGLMSVIFGNAVPAQAIEEIEAKQS